MEIAILIWVVCAGVAYMVARDRAPSKAGMAAALGFFLGPIGLLISFFFKDEEASEQELDRGAEQ